MSRRPVRRGLSRNRVSSPQPRAKSRRPVRASHSPCRLQLVADGLPEELRRPTSRKHISTPLSPVISGFLGLSLLVPTKTLPSATTGLPYDVDPSSAFHLMFGAGLEVPRGRQARHRGRHVARRRAAPHRPVLRRRGRGAATRRRRHDGPRHRSSRTRAIDACQSPCRSRNGGSPACRLAGFYTKARPPHVAEAADEPAGCRPEDPCTMAAAVDTAVMPPIEHDVFVCCRDGAGRELANRIAESLSARGFHVILTDRAPGAAPDPARLALIEQTPDFILVLTPACSHATGPRAKGCGPKSPRRSSTARPC